MPTPVPQSELPDNLKVVPESELPPELAQASDTQSEGNKMRSNLGMRTVDKSPGWLSPIINMTKEQALPTGLGMLGAYGGNAVGGPIVGGIGESVLSGVGEGINQMTGITPRSNTAIGLQMAAGPLGRVIGPAAKKGGEIAMKMFGTRELVAGAANGYLEKMLLRGPGSQALYSEAEKQAAGLITPSKSTAKVVTGIVDKELAAMPTEVRQEILNAVGPLKEYFNIAGTPASQVPTGILSAAGKPIMRKIPGTAARIADVPATEMMDGVARLRISANKAFESGNTPLYRAINDVRSSIMDDLVDSGVPAVKKAAAAYRKEMAVEELSQIVRQPRPYKEWKDAIAESKFFSKSFDPGEKAQIDRILKKIAWVSPTGGGGHIGKTISTGLGYHLGKGLGGFFGFLAPEAVQALLGTPFGRNMAEKILGESAWRGAAKYTGTQAARLAALQLFARGLTANEPLPE